MPYLKVLLMVWFHKILKLIFHKQPSCHKKNMYFEENKLDTFLENFLILLKQRVCRTRVNSCVECAINLFPMQNTVFT